MAVQVRVDWLTCDEDGCIGIRLDAGDKCLAHAGDEERDAALEQVAQTGRIDARGVTISSALLKKILDSTPRNPNGHAMPTEVQFNRATFQGDDAMFTGATFQGSARFTGATFQGYAGFGGATFQGDAMFAGATFKNGAWFAEATFEGNAKFTTATFGEGAWFADVTFKGDAGFTEATFGGNAGFTEATFEGVAGFERVTFKDVMFLKAKFKGNAAFNGATSTGHTLFAQATFEGDAGFDRATFKDAIFMEAAFEGAWFDKATFGVASFNMVTFKGRAWFADVTFKGDAGFAMATLEGEAQFSTATFEGEAAFPKATFEDAARFTKATFKGGVSLIGATFKGEATFDGATVGGTAEFIGATFKDEARFAGTTFEGAAWVTGMTFEGDATFAEATFKAGSSLALDLEVKETLNLDGVQVASPVQIWTTAAVLSCQRARFLGGVQLYVHRALVCLDDSDFSVPSLLAGPALAGSDSASVAAQPKLLSLQGANVAGLTLGNIDLAACRFAGSHNLDKLRLDAGAVFGFSPVVAGWERREVIAEESAWRAARPQPCRWVAPAWPNFPGTRDRPKPPSPGVVAGLYRALRKGREDAKDEPGAADFYYGEMEMRRHAHGRADQGDSRSHGRVDRGVLTAYWLVSGYGLRAWRALAWLVGITVAFALAFHLVGFTRPPEPATYWTSLLYAFRSTISLTDDQVTLTAWGQLLQALLRLTGPVLLGLALLALRNRVKR